MYIDGHLINVTCAALMSLAANLTMVFAVQKSKRLTSAYRIQMYVTAAICLFYTTINVFVNPTIAVIYEDMTVLFVKGGIDTSFYVGNALLDVFVFLVVVSAILPTIQFVYRYLNIVHAASKHRWEKSSTWLFVIIPIFLAVSSSLYFCYEMQPNQIQQDRYNQSCYYINILGYTSFLVASTKIITSANASVETFDTDWWTLGAMSYMALVMFIANCVIIFTYLSIRRALREDHASSNTTKLHHQLNKTLTAQALIPFITIHLPFYVSCLAPALGWYIFVINDYLPYLFSYYSVFTPLSVVYYSKDIRKMLFSSCRSPKATNMTHTSSTEPKHWAEHR